MNIVKQLPKWLTRQKAKTLLLYAATFVFLGYLGVFVLFPTQDEVDYNTDIKPILNKKCMDCHGGVKKQAGFSLLFRKQALDTTENGHVGIVPGHPEQSEMVRRITHGDPEQRMPPEGAPLSEKQINLIKRWIEQGAEFEKHWAYQKPEAAPFPEVKPASWPQNGIDHFILDKLNEEKLQTSREADRSTLIRRVSLDLIGLPPTPEQVEEFVNDTSEDAYEKVVDRLLDSKHFGERWASMWLDLARYADSRGYEKDDHREIWRYRDWVIKAFNQNKPFDEFTIEQLAGDMLDNPTAQQYIATAFHRNTMNNDEGGTNNEEFRVAAVLDRVNTTYQVFQATTMECVQCHSHPYDPFKQEEYYQSYAFFNNTRDEDTYSEAPNYRVFQEEDQQKITEVRNWIMDHAKGDKAVKTAEAEHYTTMLHIPEPKVHPHNFDSITNGTHAGVRYLKMYKNGYCRLPDFEIGNKTRLLINYIWAKPNGTMEIRKDSLNGPLIKTIHFKGDEKGVISYQLDPVPGTHDLFFRFNNPQSKRDVSNMGWLVFHEPMPGQESPGFDQVKNKFVKLLNTESQNTPVMKENPEDFRRETHMFVRGNWRVPGEKVKPGVPDELPGLSEDGPNNRLGFAQWLVSDDNPLTSRVIVNRFWHQLFGRGIVKTLGDFGSQGSAPTHPRLLDWLAVKFQHDYDWDMKKLLKTMVMSATYRQDSKISRKILALDPNNKFLARGPRFRLSAEQIRDQALAVSGLLSDKMYGESVMPPQPPGVWNVVYSGMEWKTSKGEDRYRRALYTYWRRTSPYPSMTAFDAPSREFCTGKRIRTNTPLQALVTLNDPVYIEAAQGLALKMMNAADDLKTQIRAGYKKAMFHDISQSKLEELVSLYEDAIAYYEDNPQSIKQLLDDPAKEYMDYKEKEGEGAGMEEEDVNLEVGDQEGKREKLNCQGDGCKKLAGLTVVANTIMNLDEFITKG